MLSPKFQFSCKCCVFLLPTSVVLNQPFNVKCSQSAVLLVAFFFFFLASDVKFSSDVFVVTQQAVSTNKFQQPKPCENGLSYCGDDEGEYPLSQIDEMFNRIVNESSIVEGDTYQADKLLLGRYFDRQRRNQSDTSSESDDKLDALKGNDTEMWACKARHDFLPLYTRAMNVDGKWRYVLQSAAGRVQHYQMIICEESSLPCRNDKDSPHGPLRTLCRQLFSIEKLLIIDDQGELEADLFKLPSACACYHQDQALNSARFGPLNVGKEGISSAEYVSTQLKNLPNSNSRCRPKTSSTDNGNSPDRENVINFHEIENHESSSNNETPTNYDAVPLTGGIKFIDRIFENIRNEMIDTDHAENENKTETLTFKIARNKTESQPIVFVENDIMTSHPQVQTRSIRKIHKKVLTSSPSSICQQGNNTEDDFGIFCDLVEGVDTYPSSEIESAVGVTLKRDKDFENFFSSVSHEGREDDDNCDHVELNDSGDEMLENRFGNLFFEQPLCYSTQRYIFPKKGTTLNGETRYIVNTDAYKQAVSVNFCSRRSTGSPCLYGGLTGFAPKATICKQVYGNQNLMVVGENFRLYVDTFLIPSACICHIVNENEFLFE